MSIPEGFEIKLLEAAKSPNDGYERLCRHCDGEISKAILGETLTSEVGSPGGNRALGEVHNEVRKKLAKDDADELSYTLNQTIVRWIVELNFPDRKPPTVWRNFDEAEDRDAVAERDRGTAALLDQTGDLQLFRNRLSELLEQEPSADFVEQLGSVRRLETIFRTNMQVAYSAGDWEQIREGAESAPYLMYDTVGDQMVRPIRAAWDGITLRWDDPWWSTHSPPNGFGCRCSKIQLNEADLKALGITLSQAPPVTMREYTNKRTSEITLVPDGIDPGFTYNPGASRVQQLQSQLQAKQLSFFK